MYMKEMKGDRVGGELGGRGVREVLVSFWQAYIPCAAVSREIQIATW